MYWCPPITEALRLSIHRPCLSPFDPSLHPSPVSFFFRSVSPSIAHVCLLSILLSISHPDPSVYLSPRFFLWPMSFLGTFHCLRTYRLDPSPVHPASGPLFCFVHSSPKPFCYPRKCARGVCSVCTMQEVSYLVGYLVCWCFTPSQPQRIISGLRETFIKKCIVERTSKADLGPKEQIENAESCRENLWNEIQLKGP